MDFSNKTVVITGAGSGIGRAIAQRFARHHARVEVLDIDAQAAESTAELLREEGCCSVTARPCDVADEASVRAAFDAIASEHKRLDVLVNNAGVASIGALLETSAAELDRVYAVNVKGVYHCLQAGIPQMIASGGGAILNLASIASLIGVRDRFAYSMSKGAVLTMTYSVAIDYIQQGIRCNCICPARIHTPFVDGYLKKHHAGHEREVFEKLSRYQPIGRMGTPEEVASLAVFLCSDEAAFITGAAYPLDGGVTTLI